MFYRSEAINIHRERGNMYGGKGVAKDWAGLNPEVDLICVDLEIYTRSIGQSCIAYREICGLKVGLFLGE